MGNASFLVSSSEPPRGGLLDSIERLERTSIIFVHGLANNNKKQATSVYHEAMSCFDHIVNEFVRIRDSKKRVDSYIDSRFEHCMQLQAARMVSATRNDHYANAGVGPGNAQLPNNGSAPADLNFEKTLVKLKHRLDEFSNYRIENGNHIFVVCIEKIGGGADCIIEFDVIKFCKTALNCYNEI